MQVSELKQIGWKALMYQRYILRRAYAYYYASWAFTILLYLTIPLVFPQIGNFGLFVIYITIGIITTLFSGYVFRKARRRRELYGLLSGKRTYKLNLVVLIVWWVAFILAIDFGYYYFRNADYLIVNLFLIFIAIFLAVQLRASFPEGIPFEGLLASFSFGLSASLGLLLSILGFSSFSTVLWFFTVVCWFLSSYLSFERSQEELELSRY